MKKTINILSLIALVILSFTACKKNDTKAVIKDFTPKNTLSASNENILIDSINSSSKLSSTALNWTKPDYGFEAGVIYALEVATKEENLGLTAPGSIALKTDSQGKIFLNYPNKIDGSFFTYEKLNSFLLSNGYSDTVNGKLFCRIKNTISFTDKPANNDLKVSYSNILVLNVRPFKKIELAKSSLWVPGNYQMWSPATATSIEEETAGSGIYEGIVDFQDAGTDFRFKFTSVPSWNGGTNYGVGATPSQLSTDGAADNLLIPSADVYMLTADINALTWSSSLHSWGLIGPTQGGWTDDTNLRYNSLTKEWTLTKDLVAGDFKIRFNDAWTDSYGYATLPKSSPIPTDNTAVELTNANGNDMNIPIDGNYTITFNVEAKTIKVNKN
jgi:starch-binding outer membrane protein SusE/F